VSGELLGTAAYISPEQAVGEPATAASDRYAFAVVTFEALTGGLPFGGGTLVEIAPRRTELDPPRASERLPDVPRAVDDVMLRGLAREPAERWPTATALVDALDRALAQPTTATQVAPPPAQVVPPATQVAPPPAPPPASPSVATYRAPRRRIPLAPLLLGLAAIVVGLIVGVSVLNGGGDGDGGSERAADRAQARERADARRRQERRENASPAPAQETPPQQAQPSGEASPAELNDQGFALMNSGRYDQAIPVLQRAVAGFPEGSTDLTLAYALYNLGRSLRLAGRPDEAIPILERRLQFNNQRGAVRKELNAARNAAGGDTGGARQGGGDGGSGGGEEEGD
jgi:eukaryotic-like serine/threonine-protein kinase